MAFRELNQAQEDLSYATKVLLKQTGGKIYPTNEGEVAAEKVYREAKASYEVAERNYYCTMRGLSELTKKISNPSLSVTERDQLSLKKTLAEKIIAAYDRSPDSPEAQKVLRARPTTTMLTGKKAVKETLKSYKTGSPVKSSSQLREDIAQQSKVNTSKTQKVYMDDYGKVTPLDF